MSAWKRCWVVGSFVVLLAACGGAEGASGDGGGGDGGADGGTWTPDGGVPHDASASERDASDGDAALTPDGDAGELVDLCAEDNGGCDPLVDCTVEDGAAVCGDCPAGYSGAGDTGCVDVDECEGDPCAGDHEACVNEIGGHRCECEDGYARVDGACTDTDECLDPASCVPGTTCTNTPGSYECSPCPAPSLGDPRIACVSPPPAVRFYAHQDRSLSTCFTAGRGLPINFRVPTIPPRTELAFIDPMVESLRASLEVTVERDAGTPLRAVITDIASGECPVREDTHIRCHGMIFDIDVMLSAFNVISSQTGSGTVRVRYCSPAVPSCSELRMRVTVDSGDRIDWAMCDAPPRLDPASDDGVAIDDLTSDFSPTFTVASTPGTTITWYRDDVMKGTAVVGSDGIATFTDALPGDAPAPGIRGYSVRHEGAAERSAARYVTLVAPAGG